MPKNEQDDFFETVVMKSEWYFLCFVQTERQVRKPDEFQRPQFVSFD